MTPFMTIADVIAYLNETGQTAMARIVDIVAKEAEQQRQNCRELCQERDRLLARLPRSHQMTYRAPAESDG